MAINIKNKEVEELIEEVAHLANETKTEAVRKALLVRRNSLRLHNQSASRKERLEDFLLNRAWPFIPKKVLGKPLTKEQEEEILGYTQKGI